MKDFYVTEEPSFVSSYGTTLLRMFLRKKVVSYGITEELCSVT